MFTKVCIVEFLLVFRMCECFVVADTEGRILAVQ